MSYFCLYKAGYYDMSIYTVKKNLKNGQMTGHIKIVKYV